MENSRDRKNAMSWWKHARRANVRVTDNAGFSFIDVMLSLVVLAFGVLALADLQVVASSGNTASKMMTSAITVAEKKMEEVKNTPYASIVAEPATQVTSSGLTFTRQVTITANAPILNATTVNVIVTWTEGSATRSVKLSSIMAI